MTTKTEKPYTKNITKIKFKYKVNDIIYFTAFPKRHPDNYFVCKGVVIETIEKRGRPSYRVKILEVGEKPLVQSKVANPKHLLGKIITKKETELVKVLTSLMIPNKWIK